jgi:three-Cys-motif partner protein
MSELADGDDGYPVAEVGDWTEKKHQILLTYLKYHAHPRAGFVLPGKAGATYIDLFCGPGRLLVRNTGKYVDGSAVVAWKSSQNNAPFSQLYIADKDPIRRQACASRLRALGAPVVEIEGAADKAVDKVVGQLDPYGFHFAFLDPYSLGALRLEILQRLSELKRMDLLIHLSAMDLFRNFERNLSGECAEFDAFAPGWVSAVSKKLPQDDRRRATLEYWRGLIDKMDMDARAELKPVRNQNNRDLYWLLLVSRHELAKKFWKIVLAESEVQMRLL